MHNVYVTGGEFDFIGQFIQLVYTTIISQILQTFINYLTMTDIHYYKLKVLKNNNRWISKIVLYTIKSIKIKIIVYFCCEFCTIFIFLVFTESEFCEIYPNTQRIFIGDSFLSFLMRLLYPFALSTTLRYISLKYKEKKNFDLLYVLSDKISKIQMK